MSRFRHFNDLDNQGSGIDISPLIDVVFILLIFFIVTTVFVEESGVTVQKPKAATAQTLEKQSIFVSVTQGGDIYHAGHQVSKESLHALLAALLEENANTPVIIQGDKNAPHGTVVSVIDAAKLAGAHAVHLATAK